MSTKKRPTAKKAEKPSKAKVVAAPSPAMHTNPARAAIAGRRR